MSICNYVVAVVFQCFFSSLPLSTTHFVVQFFILWYLSGMSFFSFSSFFKDRVSYVCLLVLELAMYGLEFRYSPVSASWTCGIMNLSIKKLINCWCIYAHIFGWMPQCMYASQMAHLGICYHLTFPLEHGLSCPFCLLCPVWLLVSQLPDNCVYLSHSTSITYLSHYIPIFFVCVK